MKLLPKPKKDSRLECSVNKKSQKILDTFTELEAKKKQYKYYRDELLEIKNIEHKALMKVEVLIRGTGLQKKDFVETGIGCIHYGQIYTYYGSFADRTKTFMSPELTKKLKKAQKAIY